MDCCGIQDKSSVWNEVLLEGTSHQINQVNQNIQSILKYSLESFVTHYHYKYNQKLLLAINWSQEAPHSQKDIDETREAAYNAKEEADNHIKNAWEALGNYHPGTVIRESIEGFKSLRESERLEKEAVGMENNNIDYENERK